MRFVRGVLVWALLPGGLACGPHDQVTESMDAVEAMQHRENMPLEVVAAIDSGTAAYRARDYQAALTHYRAVTELAPEVAAGWFGVYMAERALGHGEEAVVALQRARAIAPGATVIHPTDPDTVR